LKTRSQLGPYRYQYNTAGWQIAIVPQVGIGGPDAVDPARTNDLDDLDQYSTIHAKLLAGFLLPGGHCIFINFVTFSTFLQLWLN